MSNDHASGLNAALAAELRAEKSAQRLTNEEISGRSGMPLVTVQRLLAARRGIDVQSLSRLADALGVDPAELVSRASRRMHEEHGRTG